MSITNRQKNVLIIWAVIGVIGILMIVAGFSEVIDIMEGGGALIAFGFILSVTGIITILFYYKRAKIMDDMIKGVNVLARWTYDKEYWDKFTEENHRINKKEKGKIFLMIMVIAFVIFLFLGIIAEEEGYIFFYTFFGLFILLLISYLLSVYVPYRRNKKNPGITIISTDGVYVTGAMHSWQGMSVQFEKFEFVTGDTPYFEFYYSAPTRSGRETYSVRVPIPEKDDPSIKKVIDYYNSYSK